MGSCAKADRSLPDTSELPCVGVAILPRAQESVAVECPAVGPDVSVVVQLSHGEGNERVGGDMETVLEGVGFHSTSPNSDCELLSICT